MIPVDRATDDDDRGGAPDFFALDAQLLLGRLRGAGAPCADRGPRKGVAQRVIQHDQPPGLEPAMVRCLRSGLQHAGKFFRRGAGRRQLRSGRAAVQRLE